MKEQDESKGVLIQRRISVLVTVLLVLAVLLCLYVTVQVLSNGYVNIGGFMMFRVVTGSMEPTIPVGALLVTKQVPIDTVQLEDIVCFRTQEAAIWGRIVTHRVVGILESAQAGALLETKGDANLTMDGYLVSAENFIGKVIWHTGDDSVLADIFAFFTNKVGFMGCIVFPCLLLAALILRDCIGNIRKEMQSVIDEINHPKPKADWETDPLCGMTMEEYQQMYERIRAELIEELTRCGQIPKEESQDRVLSESAKTDKTE